MFDQQCSVNSRNLKDITHIYLHVEKNKIHTVFTMQKAGIQSIPRGTLIGYLNNDFAGEKIRKNKKTRKEFGNKIMTHSRAIIPER